MQPDPEANTDEATEQDGLGKLVARKQGSKRQRVSRPQPDPKHREHDQQHSSAVDPARDRARDHANTGSRDHDRDPGIAGSSDRYIAGSEDHARDHDRDPDIAGSRDQSPDPSPDHQIRNAQVGDTPHSRPDAPIHEAEPQANAETVGLDWSTLNPVDNTGAAWAAAARRTQERAQRWTEQLQQARSNGATPDQLRDLIHRSAVRARVDPRAVPVQVWHAANLHPPEAP